MLTGSNIWVLIPWSPTIKWRSVKSGLVESWMNIKRLSTTGLPHSVFRGPLDVCIRWMSLSWSLHPRDPFPRAIPTRQGWLYCLALEMSPYGKSTGWRHARHGWRSKYELMRRSFMNASENTSVLCRHRMKPKRPARNNKWLVLMVIVNQGIPCYQRVFIR